MVCAESQRLEHSRNQTADWKKWGPYLSERQWGTVREDHDSSGNSWQSFSHDHARSRVYRWGEDGIAGISDDRQRLCFALALWNGQDSILKERLFGLTNGQGNHGEDVKEYYYYLDSTPTHSYMKFLYKYPQAAFPYEELVKTNAGRSKTEPEFELIDTGVFAENRYFDIEVEYAKAGTDDILIRITAHNRGPEAATLHLLPTLWYRNYWLDHPESPKPQLEGRDVIHGTHPDMGDRWLHADGEPPLLYTDNETNIKRIFDKENTCGFVKDGINNHVISGSDSVNPEQQGTKASAHYIHEIDAGESVVIRLRLTDQQANEAFTDFDSLFETRRQEADYFYSGVIPNAIDGDSLSIIRQALGGMMWTKQYYEYDVEAWLNFRKENKASIRNGDWGHMQNRDIISMPDKWEYPWYATWDLAFHCWPLAMVDPEFAKDQLLLFLSDRYMHPNGQMPAYEWNFSDTNPPVHATAVLATYNIDHMAHGTKDLKFLKRCFNKLLLNFYWWMNKKDVDGNNLFGGGFLGLDNIGVFDRSSPLPTGGNIEQSDGTAWMGIYAQAMLQIAIELALNDDAYEDMAITFLNHYIAIASAMAGSGEGHDAMWDNDDGFYYDVLRFPDGSGTRIKVRSLVGLLPLCATCIIEDTDLEALPRFREALNSVSKDGEHGFVVVHRPRGGNTRHMLSLMGADRMAHIVKYMLDEDEFLGPFGIRSLSKYHEENPYTFEWEGETFGVSYLPGESDSRMFGGNSNWRGPIWMPANFLLIKTLLGLYSYFGEEFTLEFPTGSGNQKTLFDIFNDLVGRLESIFTVNGDGQRPVYGGAEVMQNDPHWKDHILFYEYFHADDGSGLGASHQTGWTGLIAALKSVSSSMQRECVLADGLAHAVGSVICSDD